MPTTRLRYTLTAGAATALLLFTGCTGDSEAGPPPLPTVSPAPTVGAFAESPEPEPQPEPKPESARQYIKRWAATSQQMQVSGDTASFREMSAHCRNCLGLADRVDRAYKAGGYIKTKGWRVLKVVTEPSERKRIQAFVSVQGRPTEYKESRNAKVVRLNGGPQDFRFVLRRNQQSWNVIAYFVAADS